METSARTRNPRGSGTRLRDEIVDAAIALIDETGRPGRPHPARHRPPGGHHRAVDLPALPRPRRGHHGRARQPASTNCATPSRPRSTARTIPAAPSSPPGDAYVRFAWDHPARYRLMFAASGYAPDAVATFALVEGGDQGLRRRRRQRERRPQHRHLAAVGRPARRGHPGETRPLPTTCASAPSTARPCSRPSSAESPASGNNSLVAGRTPGMLRYSTAPATPSEVVKVRRLSRLCRRGAVTPPTTPPP